MHTCACVCVYVAVVVVVAVVLAVLYGHPVFPMYLQRWEYVHIQLPGKHPNIFFPK